MLFSQLLAEEVQRGALRQLQLVQLQLQGALGGGRLLQAQELEGLALRVPHQQGEHGVFAHIRAAVAHGELVSAERGGLRLKGVLRKLHQQLIFVLRFIRGQRHRARGAPILRRQKEDRVLHAQIDAGPRRPLGVGQIVVDGAILQHDAVVVVVVIVGRAQPVVALQAADLDGALVRLAVAAEILIQLDDR